MFDDLKVDKVGSFLNKLSYWQKLNLYITLLQSETDITYHDAKGEALANVLDDEKLKYKLTEAINSPSPRRDYRLEKERFNRKLDNMMLDSLIKSEKDSKKST